MALKDGLLAEIKHEAASTKKILEKVPVEHLSWKPHEKSMTLGRLASHVAEIPRWVSNIIRADEYNFQTQPMKRNDAQSKEELLTLFEETLNKAVADIEAVDNEELFKTWTVKNGEHTVFQLAKIGSLRGWAYNHLYHHRGQLSVYLRLLDIPVPGMYGPSADESMV
ncbi:DinB family protein [Ferruginibacter albus]|uniref:DinB family protein n=1 Tax=Ferruginibacter albus TaxID=2875540 RepID=UPI001CC33994|nr:DinB family protein [Ferruginibacter albus]UAY53407.1 DinB family protein [Ferruginibacter albus]